MIPGILLAAAAAVLQPHVAYTIDPSHALIEGIATDGRTAWVSSVLDRTILACRKTCRQLAQLPEGLHPMGLAWDTKRQRLWIAADCPKIPGVVPCERGALVSLDKRGRLRSRLAPEIGEFHPGDVSASKGRVFVSDSQSGMVWALGMTRMTLSAVVLPGVGNSAQGTALDPTDTRLVVADYSQGVGTVDPATYTRTLLMRPEGKPLRGIDGLVRAGDRYYAIYNGASPAMLLSFAVDGDKLTFEPMIEGGILSDPTQLAVDGRSLLVVAESGWALIERGKKRTKGAIIVRVALPGR